MQLVSAIAELILAVPKEIDRRTTNTSIEHARQSLLAAERRRHPSSSGIYLGTSELVSSRRPVHRDVSTG